MFRSINNDLQWQLQVLKEKKELKCDHKHQCGCGLKECHNCRRISGCSKCKVSDTDCNWCGKTQNLCSDQNCIKYYERRNDNCDCNSKYCTYCATRLTCPIY